MASQHGGVGELPNDIILNIVEQMDSYTLESFMATNKGIYRIIQSYERSISKSRAATFTLLPLGNVLSSSTTERRVLQRDTFAMVREFELREDRIICLIKDCPSVFCLTSPLWLPCLTGRQQARLVSILKRALCQCDRIADIAANVSGPEIPPERYRAIMDGDYELASAFSSNTEAEFEFNPLTRYHARPKQIEYIKSLPLEEIAGIFMLLNILGYRLTCFCSHDTAYERKAIIEECVLRHGTWFVWCRLLGDSAMREMASYITSAGKAELRQWEAGAIDGPPGLKMTLIGRLNKMVGGVTRDEVMINIGKALNKLVIGDEQERTG